MDYRTITSERQFKDATSYSKSDFLKLLQDYEKTYTEKQGKSYKKYIEENTLEKPKLTTLGDALFFVLFKLKNDMIWGSFGLVFGMSEASAHRNFDFFLNLLEETLRKKKVMPKRSFETVPEFEAHVCEAEELIFDGTENSVERPQNNDNQKLKYSGKKKTHTDIALVLSDKKTWIYYVSQLYEGSNVDMGILKKEFVPGEGWFKNFKMLFDLGFVGVEKIYEMKEVIIGKKKPRKSKNNPNPELSEEQKARNKQVSSERIFVEHAIGKMKIFRILKNRCRFKCQKMKNKIIGICAGLWNHKLSLKS